MAASRFLGFPSYHGSMDAVTLLASGTALVMTIIALAQPSWRIFVTNQDKIYTIGLWSACSPVYCGSAWGENSPFSRVNILDIYVGYYHQFYTPPSITTAQVTLILALICQIATFYFWGLGWHSGAMANTIPAILCTIGTLSAARYFTSPGVEKPNYVMGLRWGTAADCAFVAVALLWFSVLTAVIGYWFKGCKERSAGKREPDTEAGVEAGKAASDVIEVELETAKK